MNGLTKKRRLVELAFLDGLLNLVFRNDVKNTHEPKCNAASPKQAPGSQKSVLISSENPGDTGPNPPHGPHRITGSLTSIQP